MQFSQDKKAKFEPVMEAAAWTAADLKKNQSWVYKLSKTDQEELDVLVAGLETRVTDILEISRKDIELPTLGPKLVKISNEIIHGRGLAMIRGVPVKRYNRFQSALAMWCIGLFVGDPVSQNAKGHLLGHVKNLGGTSLRNPKNRGYQTDEGLPYHCDSCDVVGLMCLNPAKRGGKSAVVSSLNIYNEMLKFNPALVAVLAGPIFRDRRNEIPEGKKPWFQLPVFNFCDGYLTVSWQGGYIRSAARFKEFPKQSAKLKEAIKIFSKLSDELAYKMEFKPGDIQFLHNHVTVHSRTSFEDYSQANRKRHLLRLWLATPNGRPLSEAYKNRYGQLNSGQRPAGGIIVPGTLFKAPLEAV